VDWVKIKQSKIIITCTVMKTYRKGHCSKSHDELFKRWSMIVPASYLIILTDMGGKVEEARFELVQTWSRLLLKARIRVCLKAVVSWVKCLRHFYCRRCFVVVIEHFRSILTFVCSIGVRPLHTHIHTADARTLILLCLVP
jgi:hypothetical protein